MGMWGMYSGVKADGQHDGANEKNQEHQVNPYWPLIDPL